MKDNPHSPHITSILLPQAESAVNTGVYEPRQSDEVSLNLIWTSLRKYWHVSFTVSLLMMSAIAYRTYTEPRIYKSGVQIVIELKDSSGLAEKIAASAGNGSGLNEERTTTIETITQTLKSKSIIREAVDSIPNPVLKPSVDAVSRNLSIQSGQNTNILAISYTDTDPQRIVTTLNALGSAYINYSIKTKKARTDRSIAFIESQLPESRKRLEKSAEEVKQFRLRYRFIDPESSTKGLADYRQEIVKKLNESRLQYNQTQKLYEAIKNQQDKVGLNSGNILSITTLTQDSNYQDLFKKLNDFELNYNQEKLRFSDENPIVVAAKQRRDQVLFALKNREHPSLD